MTLSHSQEATEFVGLFARCCNSHRDQAATSSILRLASLILADDAFQIRFRTDVRVKVSFVEEAGLSTRA